ncbi:MAG: ATP synthase F1 subunit gamma [Candidatus Latescibacteria bacterium]|nr:ATP synthase F1 subunit gamma [Candidatus Latescibacterota bacterium]
MPTLRDIQTRIASVESTRQITNTMQMVAAAKLRRAQERIFAARPYSDALDRVLKSLAMRAKRDVHPLLAERKAVGKVGLVVVTADRGLCAGFNGNILRRATLYLDEHRDEEVAVFSVGRKARDFFRYRAVPVADELFNFFDRLEYRHSREIVDKVIEWFIKGEVDRVDLIYNEFKSAIRQDVVVRQLLPIFPSEPGPDESRTDYLYEPSEGAVFDRLLPRHLTIQVWRMLLESSAAEQGARMTAMESATDNADEMIEKLTLSYNKARQGAITTELLDIAGGAEALQSAAV